MKKLIALTALVATTATGAFAMVDADANLKKIQNYVPTADVTVLTDAEVLSLLNVIHSSDTESEKRAAVRAFFN